MAQYELVAQITQYPLKVVVFIETINDAHGIAWQTNASFAVYIVDDKFDFFAIIRNIEHHDVIMLQFF